MEVLLVKDIERVGNKGETLRVTEGYARNFLFPRNLAVPASDGARRHLKLVQSSWDRQATKEKEAIATLARKVDGAVVKITKKAGEKGRLFGSVTSTEIAESLHKDSGATVDKRHIIADHIKELGEHEIHVKFGHDVKATIKVIVLPEEATVQA